MKKKILAIGVLGIYSCMFLGCNVDLTKLPTIPFEKFVLEGETEEEDIELEEVTNCINLEELNKLTQNVNGLFDLIYGKEYYYENYYDLERYFENTKDFFTDEYYKNLLENKNNDLKKIADNIYSKENQLYKQTEIIEFEGNVDERYVVIEIAYLNDSKSFIVDRIKLNIDDECRISNSEIISQGEVVDNTTKALSADDSILNNNEVDNFRKVFSNFLGNMYNEELYENIEDEESQLELTSLIENLNLENKDSEVLKNLFLAGRGTFKNYYITKVYLEDKDALAKSIFTVSFVNGSNVKEFKVYFSRINQSITSISM